MKKMLVILTVAAVSACSSEPLIRFEVPPQRAVERVRISYETVSVREVSLPIYASTEEISRADTVGRVSTVSESLWADDPVRAITLDVARTLKEITGARVAPDPWPYRSQPEVVVDIRFEELLPSASGQYRANGLYFVAPDSEDRREHAHEFNISVPFDPNADFRALVEARAQLVAMLALEIAKSALR